MLNTDEALGLVERAIAVVRRRQRLAGADGDDFASIVRLHVIEDDYAVLRAHQGRSSLQTYLIAVVMHRFQDWRNAEWGKWRASAEARRLGPTAVLLERLLVRDGLTFDEAYESLRTNHRLDVTRRTVEEFAARFPARAGRTFVPDDSLVELAAADNRADAPMRHHESIVLARQATGALANELGRLGAQDRLILRLRFEGGCSVAEVSRMLQLDHKGLYRRIERLLGALRRALEAAGVSSTAMSQAFEDRGFDAIDSEGAHEELLSEVRPSVVKGLFAGRTRGSRD